MMPVLGSIHRAGRILRTSSLISATLATTERERNVMRSIVGGVRSRLIGELLSRGAEKRFRVSILIWSARVVK